MNHLAAHVRHGGRIGLRFFVLMAAMLFLRFAFSHESMTRQDLIAIPFAAVVGIIGGSIYSALLPTVTRVVGGEWVGVVLTGALAGLLTAVVVLLWPLLRHRLGTSPTYGEAAFMLVVAALIGTFIALMGPMRPLRWPRDAT